MDTASFRIYYNDRLHAELVRLEGQRRRLVWLLGFSILLFVLATVGILLLRIPALTMFLLLPIVFWTSIIGWRIRVFRNNFKPKILPLILEFISPELRYYHGEFVAKDTFNRSGIFGVNPQIYKGEDYIKGRQGGVDYEMCELDVRHPSELQGRLVPLFKGIFFHAVIPYEVHGRMIILPLEDREKHTRGIRAITKTGGRKVSGLEPAFEKYFLVYAEEEVNPHFLLSAKTQLAFADYRRKSRKKLYLSFSGSHFFAAIEEPYNLLEPNILLPNVDFELMKEYYLDLKLLTSLVEEFDLTH